jgi:hypothetical protein
MEDVIQDAEVHRCVITIVNFVAVCTEDLKVGLDGRRLVNVVGLH